MLFIPNKASGFMVLIAGDAMTYRIEIQLPNSSNWFKYFIRIESLEEAESIRRVAEGKINARILENM